jgi:translation initiation factor IF-1
MVKKDAIRVEAKVLEALPNAVFKVAGRYGNG